MSSPKILYLVTEDWYFWSHRLALAEATRSKGFQVIVVTRDGEYSDRIKAKGFELVTVPINRAVSSPLNELRTLLRLVAVYRKYNPDLVHHVALKTIFLGTLAAKFSRVPNVINAYTGLGHVFISSAKPSSFFFKFVLFPLFSLLLKGKKVWSIIQNQNDYDQLKTFRLLSDQRTKLIRGSGVDLSVFQLSRESETAIPVILFASRLLKDKGIREFVAAAKDIRNQNIDARFVIVGDRDVSNPSCISSDELQSWLDDGTVEWWGFRDDMVAVFKQAHIVCLPSYREGLPKVLLEAAASGKPIVTTDVPGCRDVVKHGINGLLVPAKNSEELGLALRQLLHDKSRRLEMGVKGRKLVSERFSLDTINDQTIDLYSKLVHPHT